MSSRAFIVILFIWAFSSGGLLLIVNFLYRASIIKYLKLLKEKNPQLYENLDSSMSYFATTGKTKSVIRLLRFIFSSQPDGMTEEKALRRKIRILVIIFVGTIVWLLLGAAVFIGIGVVFYPLPSNS